jgi:hypothetical protein
VFHCYRWYADPSTLTDRLPAAKLNGMNGESSQPVQAHPSTVTSSPVARPVVSAIPSVPLSSVPISKTSDLLADLDFFVPAVSSAGSAFSSPRKNHSSIPQSVSQPSFANFQNADFFFSGMFRVHLDSDIFFYLDHYLYISTVFLLLKYDRNFAAENDSCSGCHASGPNRSGQWHGKSA